MKDHVQETLDELVAMGLVSLGKDGRYRIAKGGFNEVSADPVSVKIEIGDPEGWGGTP